MEPDNDANLMCDYRRGVGMERKLAPGTEDLKLLLLGALPLGLEERI